jgi:hypothetical protein
MRRYGILRILVESNRQKFPQWDVAFVSKMRQGDMEDEVQEKRNIPESDGEDGGEEEIDIHGKFEWDNKYAWL